MADPPYIRHAPVGPELLTRARCKSATDKRALTFNPHLIRDEDTLLARSGESLYGWRNTGRTF